MRIKPYVGKAPRHSVGFVESSGRVRMEDGSLRRFADLPANDFPSAQPSLRLFGDAATVMERFAYRGSGDLFMYNRSYFAWRPDPDHKVLLLKDDPGNDPGVLEGLVGFRDFLADRGASIGSTGHSTRSLLRATITEPISAGVGPDGPKAILFDNVGGRMQSYMIADHYPSFLHLDLIAAYASTLGDLFYEADGQWYESRRAVIPETPTPVIAKVRVRLSGADPGPLPRRLRRELTDFERREWPTSGEMTGTFEASEIDNARAVGADVKVERVWIREHHVEHDHHPFDRWWHEIQSARRLHDYAGHLGKMAGAALWGTFAGGGDLYRIHYERGRIDKWAKLRSIGRERMWGGYDLAEIVTARVRARLYRELIQPYAERLIGVHTDGGLLVDDGFPLPPSNDWAVKYRGRLQFVSPNAYRYKTGDERRWNYVMAGVPDERCPITFAELWRAARGRRADGHAGFLTVEQTEDALLERVKRELA